MKTSSCKIVAPLVAVFHYQYGVVADTSTVDKVKDVEILTETKIESGDDTAKESHKFDAEVHRLMDIIINNLYSEKKVFLRELVSNAADAVEKARFVSIEDPEYLSENPELEIKVEMDLESKTLSIIDSGIGMTKSDLINNLGTIAKSGTNNFLEAMKDGQTDSNLIGQFGVGFYSAFLIADKVTVISKHNDDRQWVWQSAADASFTIKESDDEPLGRGTRVTMHLKDDALEFLQESTVRDLIKKYSQFVQFPIYLQTTKEVEVEDDDDEVADDKDDDDDDDVDVKDEDEEEDKKEEKEPKEKKKEIVKEWDLVNAQKAIWVRPKEEITSEEYLKFYQAISKSSDVPLAQTHFSAEGDVEFKSLLYVPQKAEHDMMQKITSAKSDIKMYVRRVLVGDEMDEFVPRYLNWIKGVVDSDDLPLNVSRENLQQSKVMKTISKKLTRKILEMLRKVAESSEKTEDDEDDKLDEEADKEGEEKKEVEKKKDAYLPIWEQFGEALKWGTFEDDANRNKLVKLLRFQTSSSDGKVVSLQSYVNRMPENQKKIYYISGDDVKAMLKSPHMQLFNKKKIEVLLLTGNNDEHVIQRAANFEGKEFASVQKGDVEQFEDSDEEKKKFKGLEKMFSNFTTWAKDSLTNATTSGAMSNMGVKVDSVKISNRLVSSPMLVAASQFGYSPKMEQMMASQGGGQMDFMKMMTEKKVIEINPYHPLINKLSKMVEENQEDEHAKSLIGTLFQTALIESGFAMSDPSSYIEKIHEIMADAMKIEDKNTLVDIEVPEEVEEEEKEEDAADNDDDADEVVEAEAEAEEDSAENKTEETAAPEESEEKKEESEEKESEEKKEESEEKESEEEEKQPEKKESEQEEKQPEEEEKPEDKMEL